MFGDVIDMLEKDDGSFDVGATVDDLFRSVTNVITDTGRDAVDKGKEVVADRGAQQVQDFINSTGGKVLLDAVEAKAQQAVVKEVSRNAIALFALAVAGGAIGGIVFKGKAGAGAAVGITGWAIYMLASKPAAPAPKR